MNPILLLIASLVAPTSTAPAVSEYEISSFVEEHSELSIAASYLFNIQERSRNCSTTYPDIQSDVLPAIRVTETWETAMARWFVGDVPTAAMITMKAQQAELVQFKFAGDDRPTLAQCKSLAARILERTLPLDISAYVGQ